MEVLNVDNIIKSIFNNNESHWNPADKIPLVLEEFSKLQNELRMFLEESQYDIDTMFKEITAIYAEGQEIIAEMDLRQYEIEQEPVAGILNSIENHKHISKELMKVDYSYNIVSDIIKCAKYFKAYEEMKQAQSFSGAVQKIGDLLQLLDNPAQGYKLPMFDNINDTAILIMDTLKKELLVQFNQLFYWKILQKSPVITIEMKVKFDQTKKCMDVLKALEISKELEKKLEVFSSFLLNDILVPLVLKPSSVYADEHIVITIYLSEENKPSFNEVTANVYKVLHYLSSNFAKCNLTPCLMERIGRNIASDFRQLIIKDCFIDTVPCSINELQSYSKTTTEIQELHDFLKEIKFFCDDDPSILSYLNDIDDLFAEKSSQHFLETARAIMMLDLSDTMSIGVEMIPEVGNGDVDLGDEATEEVLKVFDNTLPFSLFYFPRCMISKSAQKLLDLIYMMMEQALQCSDVSCKRLYITTRLVFELYDAVVPYHHENFLQSIPQYAALFHNNCMYLAHNLLTFGDKWITLMDGRALDYPITFLDLVQKLRDLGYKHLTLHMQLQRKQILDNIRSSDLNSISVKDVLGDNAEQAIRQCLRQQQLLKNVWIGVLPHNVFTRLMATLVNMFVHEIIHRVCTVEDISAEMASQLTDIYTIVVNKAPNLFHKPSDVEEQVKSWTKLQELILILGGSLKDIEKRWNEGSGPIAQHFRIEEIRSLIKALFQNTQIRANLLSKIK